jgi:hypothetical protein
MTQEQEVTTRLMIHSHFIHTLIRKILLCTVTPGKQPQGQQYEEKKGTTGDDPQAHRYEFPSFSDDSGTGFKLGTQAIRENQEQQPGNPNLISSGILTL